MIWPEICYTHSPNLLKNGPQVSPEILISTLQRTMIIFDGEHKSSAAKRGCSAYTDLACSTWGLKIIFIMKPARQTEGRHTSSYWHGRTPRYEMPGNSD